MDALLAPFGNCAQYLNSDIVKPLLEPGMKSVIKYIQDLTVDDLKDKVCIYA